MEMSLHSTYTPSIAGEGKDWLVMSHAKQQQTG